MSLELSTLAAGLPMAASFAMAGGFVALREGRRRSTLNAALHELRRPLQALSLALPAQAPARGKYESSLQMAVAAVDRLDLEINGRAVPSDSRGFPVRPLVEAAVERWRPAADSAGRPLQVGWSGPEGELRGDQVGLAQAMDNLISNALRHGGGAIAVEAEVERRGLRLAVSDRGSSGGVDRGRLPLRCRLAGRARHGHGLTIVRRAAARHGGSFQLRRSRAGTEARLELPLTGSPR
ncbi:MAG TPA: HAMP domain-containing sensor histidine kinase [Solirubrobacterales bacterium]|nr:HAMP domain-containing sensor histidine kinase [Solirubrobacterales bacterium]